MLWSFDRADMIYLTELYPDFMHQVLRSTKKRLRALMAGNEELFKESEWYDSLIAEHLRQ